MSDTSAPVGYGAASLGSGHTRDLAAFLADVRFDRLPNDVVAAARRGVLDWMGCALAGSDHPAAEILVRTLKRMSGSAGTATVLGRGVRLAPLDAALANGQMGHVLDFDDTHMGGVVLHASSAILPALFALAEERPLSGPDLIAAYAVGFEASVRAGQAAPDHHAGGWHLTGTLGSIGAGAAAGRALGLDARRMGHALAIAATQAGGMQQNRGTMSKSFHAGKAAANGLLAALLAAEGYDGSDEILEGRRGFCRIYSARTDADALLRDLGARWEITRNGHKPYACGVVLHPAIDAMIAAAAQAGPADGVASIVLTVNPAAVTITGVANPESGLKAKFSITHTAAVAFVDRAAGIAQFTNARAADPVIRDLAGRIAVRTDDALARDQAQVVVTLHDGRTVSHAVAHASGTVGNPMSDAAIAAKFHGNADRIIGTERADKIAGAAAMLEHLDDVGLLVRLAG
ncbi:MmgE/PrpD family protein [Mongoliimonas terrestris]|uniref:MmgE/PrpD family protein n=1 Tax=Mongoliimonas terrestris TaxID=1709001 RepID=UPI00094978D3|nr:MmgE/PrpD family protein [Mongoliimonas terrestris]